MNNQVSARTGRREFPKKQSEWNSTRILVIAVAALFVLATIVAFVFAVLPPYAAERF